MRTSSNGSRVYDTSDRKTFQSALRHLLHTDFPGVFGREIAGYFAERIDQLFERFHPPRSLFKMGQVLWIGVAASARPTREKRIEETELHERLLLGRPQHPERLATPVVAFGHQPQVEQHACGCRRQPRAGSVPGRRREAPIQGCACVAEIRPALDSLGEEVGVTTTRALELSAFGEPLERIDPRRLE